MTDAVLWRASQRSDEQNDLFLETGGRRCRRREPRTRVTTVWVGERQCSDRLVNKAPET